MVRSKPTVPGTGLLGMSSMTIFKIVMELIYSIHAAYFSSTPKWNKQKESSGGRVNICNVLLKVFKTSILVCYTAISKNIVGRETKILQAKIPR